MIAVCIVDVSSVVQPFPYPLQKIIVAGAHFRGVHYLGEHWQAKYSHKTQCSRIRKRMRRKCDVCGLQNRNDQPSFSVCGRCGTRRYCSEECQREDWEAGHAQKCVGCV